MRETITISPAWRDELKAFYRLSEKLKKHYPRLPICIVGDGLYPNKSVFRICEQKNWEYIITLKDGNLRSVWEEVNLLLPLQKENRLSITKLKNKEEEKTDYCWVTDIDYKEGELKISAIRNRGWVESINNSY